MSDHHKDATKRVQTRWKYVQDQMDELLSKRKPGTRIGPAFALHRNLLSLEKLSRELRAELDKIMGKTKPKPKAKATGVADDRG